jgi:hypothetical protein
MNLKALASAVIERDRLAGQRRDTRPKSVPPPVAELAQSVLPDTDLSDGSKAGAAGWRLGVTPKSRHPLIPDSVRATIEGIEADARVKGWPPELLWSAEFCGAPRGLAAVLDEGDGIGEVTSEFIEIVKSKRSIRLCDSSGGRPKARADGLRNTE